MDQSIDKTRAGNTPFADQFSNLKEVLDHLASKVVEKHEDGDIWDKVDMNKVFFKADMNYSTFIKNNGYARLENYSGIKKVENKKQIKLNPRKYLKARKLSPQNPNYIPEIHD